jgi:hypothetical protein
MPLSLQPTRVATGCDDEGMLVFVDSRLVAVLVHLSDANEIAPGNWYLEAGFGRSLDGPNHPVFANLDEAQDWIERQLRGRRALNPAEGAKPR